MRQDSLIHRAGCRRSYPARWPGKVERCTCGAVDGWEIHEPDPVTPAPGWEPTEGPGSGDDRYGPRPAQEVA